MPVITCCRNAHVERSRALSSIQLITLLKHKHTQYLHMKNCKIPDLQFHENITISTTMYGSVVVTDVYNYNCMIRPWKKRRPSLTGSMFFLLSRQSAQSYKIPHKPELSVKERTVGTWLLYEVKVYFLISLCWCGQQIQLAPLFREDNDLKPVYSFVNFLIFLLYIFFCFIFWTPEQCYGYFT